MRNGVVGPVLPPPMPGVISSNVHLRRDSGRTACGQGSQAMTNALDYVTCKGCLRAWKATLRWVAEVERATARAPRPKARA